jgi:hypothetical protein
MSKIALILFLPLLLLSCSSSNQSSAPLNQWQTEWLVAGPFELTPAGPNALDVYHLEGFETDFLQSIGGEKNPSIVDEKIFQAQGKEFAWRSFSSKDSIINMDEAVSKDENVAAYAYKKINAPHDMICLLGFGSNDGARVWLNGIQIWDRPQPGIVVVDHVLIPVHLKKGENSLLIKAEERGNMWGFCARFLPLEDRRESISFLNIAAQSNGDTEMRFLFPENHLKSLFTDNQIQVFTAERERERVWEGEWKTGNKVSLPINATSFGDYVLQFNGTFITGEKWQEEIEFTAGVREDFLLFENGRSNYEIVIDQNASSSEKWAAAELQRWVQESGNAWLPIKNRPSKKPAIYLGYDAGNTIDNSLQNRPDDEDESFIYKNVGPNIVIVGGKHRGTMYGVLSFLENELGIRWYTPTATHVPSKKKYVFDWLHHSEAPGIRVRNDFYYEAFEPIWAARNRVNGAMNYRAQPGDVESYWAVHTFFRFMPPTEFFADHPEYYSLINGERIHERAQLCLTNPEVLRIVTERLKQTMRDYPNNLIYSVSQNDWRNPCQCDECQAIVKKEGGEAGPLIWFVNKVAEAIEDEFPDKYVGTLAYQYTRQATKNIKPRENVVIRLCSIECCFSHDFESCPENASFLQDLENWAAISPHLYIWDYVVNFTHYIMPYPNFDVLQSNIKTFRDNKSIGIMEQAAYQSRGGEFAELRAYVISKLLWDPETNVDEWINDFMYGYYGRSGQIVRQYFDLLHDQVTEHTHIHLGLTPKDKLFSESFVQQAGDIFDRAEAVADNQDILNRVEMARLPLLYLKCKRSPTTSLYDGDYDKFCRIVEREGITHYAERGASHKDGFHREIENAR